MNKKKFRRYAKPAKSWLVPVLSMIAVLLLIGLIGTILYMKKGDDRKHASESQESTGYGETSAAADTLPSEETEGPAALQLPYAFENGGLEITSLFQYSGFNPDCGWEEGTNVGAVILANKSEKYLETLDLTLIMTDGTALSFAIADIPAGKTVWAFECGNQEMDSAAGILEVQYQAKFREDAGLAPELVTVSAEEMNITLTNVSAEDLTGLAVRCHGVLDDAYFGGASYTYSVETIPAGGSAVVFAEDCFLGETEATLVDYANEFVK